jgi:hypothetical protein
MSKLKTQATRTAPELDAPTAAELAVLAESGDTAGMLARAEQLNQRDFVHVFRAVRQIEKALTNYALGWQNAHYWGEDAYPFPAEAEQRA